MTEETIASQADPMRRPLLGIVFCYLAGTFAGVWIDGLHFITALAFAVFALGIAFGLHYLSKHRRGKAGVTPPSQGTFRFLPGLAICFVYLAVFLSGSLAINLRLNSPSAKDISALMDRPREGVEIIGVVADDPALRQNWRGDFQYWSFTMNVDAVCRTGSFQKARGIVLASMPTNTLPHYGERWQLCGVLLDRVRLSNDSGLDAIKSRLPCRFAFQVSDQSVPFLLTEASPRDLIRWCFVLRQKCADILARGIVHEPEVVNILHALVLGRQYELPPPLREAFVATGTYHIFAISGQHVAIIALFVVALLQIYGIGRIKWFYYLAPVLIIFTIMTGMSASAMRGCIMALVCFLGPLFKRKTDISSAMAFAALLIVGADPLQLFQAGFILSFGIVAGLIVLCPPLIAMVEKRIVPDPYQLEPEKWPARSMRSMLRWIMFMISASFAAWLVSTPLCARWFNLVSLVALPANLVVIPMATLILLTGCLSIVCGFFCPFVAEAFNFANVAFVLLTTGMTKLLAQIPFGHIFVRSPPVWFVCLWLGILVVWRICHAKSVIYYQRKIIWLAAVLVLLIAGALMWRSQRNDWEIHVFNIDQCAVCLINKAGNAPLLLNTGPRYQASRVLRYLRKMGINHIQAFICPLPDVKHIGGLKDIIAAQRADWIWCGGKKTRAGFLKELRSEAAKRRIGIRELTNEITPVGGQVWRIRSGRNGWNIDVLDGADDIAQKKKENLSRRKRDSSADQDGALTIFINAGVQTQMTARIQIDAGQTPLAINIDEASIVYSNSACFAMPAEAQCRIVCCPTAVERTRGYCGQSSDLQPPAQIALGPGQGVLLLPDKDKMKAINLDLSADGR